jgi:hypothetical protein
VILGVGCAFAVVAALTRNAILRIANFRLSPGCLNDLAFGFIRVSSKMKLNIR